MAATESPGRRSTSLRTVGIVAAATLAARALLVRAVLAKMRRDVDALNAGDYRPLLANFAPDAVLRFNDGEHRWTGEHRGKAAIERFLAEFVAAGIRGQINELLVGGPPWRMTLMVRFDDHAHDPSGREIYRNRTALVGYARWGRIVLQEDFYEDTRRIEALDATLTELGIQPAGVSEAPDAEVAA
jgi:ketosteroid isomerase-like protein